MKILISGYYGFGNVGDEAVLEAIRQEFKRRDPDIEIKVLRRNQHKLIGTFQEVKNADVLVSGGGTLFQDVTSTRSFLYYIGIILLAKLLGKKAVVFAQGFGPLRNKINRRIASFVLNNVDLITLRDSDSLEELRRIGVKRPPAYVAGDPSVLLEEADSSQGQKILGLEGIPTGKPLVGVSVRKIYSGSEIEPNNCWESKVFPALAEALDRMVKKYNYHPVFILFQCPEDMQETSKVIGQMKENSSVIFRACRPQEMLALISQFDLLIGMRLHALIFAAMSGVPMLGISYDPKVEAFMKSIGQPFISIDSPHFNVGLENILARREEIKNELESKKKELRERAALNFELFFKILTPAPLSMKWRGEMPNE